MNALDEYLEKHDERVSRLAVRLGRHPATLLRPLSGQRNPTMRIALEVERGTNGEVTALDFVKICMAARAKYRPGKPPTGQLTALKAWAAAVAAVAAAKPAPRKAHPHKRKRKRENANGKTRNTAHRTKRAGQR